MLRDKVKSGLMRVLWLSCEAARTTLNNHVRSFVVMRGIITRVLSVVRHEVCSVRMITAAAWSDKMQG